MPGIVGKYQHYKNENCDDYFEAMGVPFVGRKMMSMASPLMEILEEGDTMIIKNTSSVRTVEMKFKLGEECEENLPTGVIKSVTIKLNDNELETKSIIPENNAKCGRHYLFTDEGVVVTLTHESLKTPAKRYFRRVE